MTKAEQKRAVQFTRMCKFWRTHECKMGADCTFAHSADCTFAHETTELRPSPKPCFDFVKNGVCSRGGSCRFVHQLTDKQSKAKFMEFQPAFQMFQPFADSHYLGAYTVAVQSPTSIEEPPQYVSQFSPTQGLQRESHVLQARPGLDQIPVPTSLINGSRNRTDNDSGDEANSARLSEASLGCQGGLESIADLL